MNMIQVSAMESEEVIDKRIIKEEYRNYDLVARYWQYSYLGKIWKNRHAVEEVDAEGEDGLDELIRIMKTRVDEMLEAKRKARKQGAPTAAEYRQAFMEIAPKLSHVERLLLKAHAAGAKGEIEVDKLLKASGYSSYAPLLVSYSIVAQRLCDEIPWRPRKALAGCTTLAILLQPFAEEDPTLTLQKNAFEALSQMDW